MIKFLSGPARVWRLRVLLALLVATSSFALISFLRITLMPLRSYEGSLPPLTGEEIKLRDRLKADVDRISVDIGDRSFLHPPGLKASAEYLSDRLREQGYAVSLIPYPADELIVQNLEAKLPGEDEGIGQVIVGAFLTRAHVYRAKSLNDADEEKRLSVGASRWT